MTPRITKRRLLIGLTSAGVFCAGLGAGVLPAPAQQKMLIVTLLGGKTITVPVDVPPGTPLDKIKIPGITTPIVSVSEAPQPQSDQPVPVGQEDQKIIGKDTRAPRTDHNSIARAIKKILADSRVRKIHRRHHTKAIRLTKPAPSPANPTFSLALPGPAPVGVPNFFIDKFAIPPFLLPLYQAAGIQYGVRWELLAAINEIETDYGRNLSVSSAGAVGWMQFLPSTWRKWGVDANGDGIKDPYNPVDAIFSAARYLRAADAEHHLRSAIFAYNHADWYVDSVLLRAKLMGGLPEDLVGSLSGLTEGHFPVHARATYVDEIKPAQLGHRVARGANAARPVVSTARKGIDIFAKPGSPVIAVQDGKIVAKGVSAKLGRFVKLRDAYGNTYTYSQLKKVAQAYPAPKPVKVTRAQIARELQLPKPDPMPTEPASAGVQQAKPAHLAGALAKPVARTVRQAPARTVSAVHAVVSKERLFANPKRPAAFRHGGQEQILNADRNIAHYTVFTARYSKVFGLHRDDVTLKPLRVGSRVAAGTILGRIGVISRSQAPHVYFEIRPAGRGAPLIDPKPILDGWKLLETTAIYRAKGKNPFFGPDAASASVGQILLMSKEQLAQRVLADPGIDIYSCGRQDIRAGVIDRRVLATLAFLSASGLKPTVTALRCGHSYYTTTGNVSEHSFGDAVDIAKINGIPILGHQGPGSITDITVRRLLTLQGTLKPHQIITLMTYQGTDNTLAMADHADHIHVGFRPLYGTNTKLGQQLAQVLKPTQWIKLIDRINAISNPTVLTRPSKYAIKVGHSASAARSHRGD
jgi:hypothetical protein